MSAMRILWVKVGGLWPLHTGGRLRSFHIVSELAREHRVTVLTTHGADDCPESLAGQLPQCERVMSVPYVAPKRSSAGFARAVVGSWLSPLPVDLWKWQVPALREAIHRRVSAGEVDLCVADFLYTTPNVPLGGRVPVIFFDHNVEHIIWKRLSQVETRPWRRTLLEVEWRKMRRAEARVCARADLTIAVSELDRQALARNAPGAAICSIPTGVDTAFFHPNGVREAPASLAFIGSMDWYPNEDAILHFIRATLPGIRREVPQTSLTVVGRNPSRRLRAAAGAGVRVTGTVEDVRPYVSEAAVVVVPLRVGGGTRLKIFEALAMRKAVVATGVGAEGLPLVSGVHYLRADAPDDFARAVVSLLRDPGRRAALGAAGRRLVEEKFAWPQVARQFAGRCEQVVSARREP
jgi:glycosyltransferase involved in cell wall biosynthesis